MRKNSVLLVSFIVLFSTFLTAGGKEKSPWKDFYVEIGDIKIHYIEAGSGDRTLVFIPGWTMTAEVWREQIPYFSAREFRVICMDPRSQGLTTKTEIGNTYQQHAADLHAFLQALKIEHSYLVGWGTGVITLLEYVSSPESMKPEKLVFVDGNPGGIKVDDYPGSMTVQEARTRILSFQDDRAKATEKYVRSMFNGRQSELFYRDLTSASLKTPLAAAVTLFFDQFTGDRRLALARVPVPSLIVAAPENRIMGEYMKSKIPRSTLEMVEGAGHAVLLDKPQAFNQVLESFLGEH
jgi:non-heme chloroperoxidase